MIFQDKLIFLMQLTSTSNRQLAVSIRVDPSLISRLRSGNRSVPQNSEYIANMAEFFAVRCKTNYQLEALSEIIGRSYVYRFPDVEMIASDIALWLSTDTSANQSQTGLFLNSFNQLKSNELKKSDNETLRPKDFSSERNIYSFYGNEGRRRATLLFGQLVLASESVGEIKILTEGNTDWIWNDSAAALKISEDIHKAIDRGSIIIRIVPRMANLSMAFDSITRWLPLYATGKVKTFYYPHIRDNVFFRTLYVAPGIAALFSTSVGEGAECGTTFLTADPLSITSLDLDFMEFLKLCRPVMTVYNHERSSLQIINCLKKFFEYHADCISLQASLPFISIPLDICNESGLLKNLDFAELLQFKTILLSDFGQLVEHQRFTDVFHLESFEDIIAGKVRFAALESFLSKPAYYTPKTYLRHLQNILDIINNYPNYHIVLSTSCNLGSGIYVNERYVAIFPQVSSSLSIYATEYVDVVSALREYAFCKTRNGLSDLVNRVESISKIKQLIQQLSNYINSHNRAR